MNKFKYKAFISYKHSVDNKNAEKIEYSIKRYGKSWFKFGRKIFRDEKIISPTIDLGNEINKALRESEYLIYFASPEGAESKWIELELEAWCGKLNRCKNLIILITKGEIVNKEKEVNLIDWNKTKILPKILKKHFTTMPYYRDISKIKEFNLDNPDYKSVINSIVAKLENIEPEEMMDKAIKEVRRNRIILYFTITLLLLLTTLSLIFYYNSQENLKKVINQKNLILQKEKVANEALKEMKIAQQNEALQKFNDLEKRAIVIKNANADPTSLINQMKKIAKKHKDSINLYKRINDIIK